MLKVYLKKLFLCKRAALELIQTSAVNLCGAYDITCVRGQHRGRHLWGWVCGINALWSSPGVLYSMAAHRNK